MSRFPHLSDAPEAYGAGRNVYEQIPGEFDYERWGDELAHVRLLSVPWYGDYDNVVDFGSDEARDEWIDAQPCVEADSAWRRAPENTYRIEAPYTSALDYNYLVIDLPEETSPSTPLPGTGASRVSRLCYFVRDMRPVAPSTTELDIDLDIWATFINRIEIKYAMLARGHAPMTAVSADEYLSDPINHTRYLMTPDVDAGGAECARSSEAYVINSSIVALIFTMSDISADWEDKYGNTPTSPISSNGASSSPLAWALPSSELESFLNDATSQHPSFIQTVLAIAAAPASLVTQSTAVTFCGHSLRRAAGARTTVPLINLGTSDFGYDARYVNIAKLYTSPYAHLEITDESGNVQIIRVEDTRGALALTCALSLAWPSVSVDSYLEGYGEGVRTLQWSQLAGQSAAQLVGRWYDTLVSHDVPLFSVRQASSVAYDWGTHYDRAQQELAARNDNTSTLDNNTTVYENTTASNSTANENALASNTTARTNATNNASNAVANNALSVALNNANLATKNAANVAGVGYSNEKLRTDVQYDIGNSNAAFDAQMAQLGVAATNNTAQSAASQVTNAIGTVAEVGANLLTGDVGGAVGAAVGGLTSAANAAVDWQCANASITVSQSNNVDVYNQAVTSAYGKQDATIGYNTDATTLSNNTASTINTQTNNTQTSITQNNADLINTNAQNAKTTADANANRTLATANGNALASKNTADTNANRALSTSLSGIQNAINQAALGAPQAFGAERPGTSAIRPMMRQVNVVTEPDGAIAIAGDAMLRYGYAYDGAWEIDEWVPNNLKFCYWQLSDLWIGGSRQTPERYQSRLREIMARGVTVWRNPNEIGEVSIYDNRR